MSGPAGNLDYQMAFGLPGDQYITGDWNGDGIDSPGIFRSTSNTFYLSNAIAVSGPITAAYVFTVSGFPAGSYSAIAGNWNTNPGGDDVGIYNLTTRTFYLLNGTVPTGPVTVPAGAGITYGVRGDTPLAGFWPGAFLPSSLSLPSVLVPSTSLPLAPPSSTPAGLHDQSHDRPRHRPDDNAVLMAELSNEKRMIR